MVKAKENNKLKTFEEFAQDHKSKNTCVIYADYLETLKDYEYTDIGRLFLAILYYINKQEKPDLLTGEIKGIFKMLKHQIDFDTKKYQMTCYKNYISVTTGRYKKDVYNTE